MIYKLGIKNYLKKYNEKNAILALKKAISSNNIAF